MRNPFKKPEEQNPMTGGSSFDEAAARVTGVLEPEPAPPSADSETVVVGERLEIRPEWAEWFVRQPFEIGARLYHPAFAISDAQAEALGPKVLPLMQKIANEWIPLGSVASAIATRNYSMLFPRLPLPRFSNGSTLAKFADWKR